MKKGLRAASELDRGEQILIGVGLEQERARAGLQQFADEGLAVVHGEDQDLGLRDGGANLAGDFEAIHERERIVHDRDVRLRLHGFGDGVLSVGGLRHDLPPVVGFQNGAKAGTDHLMVVRNQNTGQNCCRWCGHLTGPREPSGR